MVKFIFAFLTLFAFGSSVDAASIVPAFGKFSSAGGSVDAAKQNINTMQVIGAEFSKPGGKPTMSIGPWVNANNPRFSNLSTAKVYAKSKGLPLHINTVMNCNSLGFDGIEVDVLRGGGINNSGTVTGLSNLHAGLAKIFYGSGLITGLRVAKPEYWGAMPDNNAHTLEVRNAVNASSNVLFSSIYLVDDIVALNDGQHIYGLNKVTCGIKMKDGTNPPAFSDYKHGLFWSDTKSNILIENLTIDGNKSNNSANGDWTNHNVCFYRGTNNVVKNVISKNAAHEGLMWYESSLGMAEDNYCIGTRNSGITTTEDDTSSGTAYGFVSRRNTVLQSGVRSDGVTACAAGITINGPNSIVEDCYVDQSGFAGVNLGHRKYNAGNPGVLLGAQDTSHSVVRRNIIKNSGYYDNSICAGVYLAHGNSITIENNLIDGVGGASANGASQHAIQYLGDASHTVGPPFGTCDDIRILNNTITNVKGSGAAFADVDGLTVRGNRFINCVQSSNVAAAGQAYFRAYGVKNVTLDNNKFINSIAGTAIPSMIAFRYNTINGVFVRPSNVLFQNNVVEDYGGNITSLVVNTGMGLNCIFRQNRLKFSGAHSGYFIADVQYTSVDASNDTRATYAGNAYNDVLAPKPIANANVVINSETPTIGSFTIPYKRMSNFRGDDNLRIKLQGFVTGTVGTKTINVILTVNGTPNTFPIRVIPSTTTGMFSAEISIGYSGIGSNTNFGVVSVSHDDTISTMYRSSMTYDNINTTYDMTVDLTVTLTSTDTFTVTRCALETT